MKFQAYARQLLAVITLIGTLGLPGLAHAFHPCIDFKKEVSPDGGITWFDANTEADAVSISGGATYRFTTTACYTDYGYFLNDILISDDVLQLYQPMPNFIVAADNLSFSYTIDAPDICKNYEGSVMNTATVTTTASDTETDIFLSASDDAWVRCEPQQDMGGQGCTPGYWKQDHHFDSWPAGITPDMTYSSIFDRIITVRIKKVGLVTDPTLAQALAAQGGQVNALARHSVAGYLNAANGDVSYDLSTAQIVSSVQMAIDNSDFQDTKDALVNFNEQGCPLN